MGSRIWGLLLCADTLGKLESIVLVPQEGYARKMSKPHKVFGIGLNKTGTSSLKRALMTLGYNHCPLRGQMTYKFFNNRFDQIFEVADDFDSFEDWPWPLMYRQVFEKYGETARYVLTRRNSPEAWLESLKVHSLITNPQNNPRKKIFGFDYPHGAENQHIAIYENHLVEVRKYFADQGAAHLLHEVCWEDGDGWQEICDFLEEPVPDTPFPHVNRRNVSPSDAARLNENKRLIAAQLQRLNES